MTLQLGADTHSIVSTALGAGGPEQMDEAIHALERRIRLYEIALAAFPVFATADPITPPNCVNPSSLSIRKEAISIEHYE